MIDRSKKNFEMEETRKAKINVNELKSLRILTESENKQLKQRIDEMEIFEKTEKSSYEAKLEEYSVLCKKMTDTLQEMTIDNGKKEQTIKMIDRSKKNFELENNMLKEELTSKISQLNSHKESNFKLTQGIDEAIEKIKSKNEQIERLKETTESEKRAFEEKIMRHEATMGQHSKL